jgi:hypothetical protein
VVMLGMLLSMPTWMRKSLWTTTAQEFGPSLNGKALIIVKALYGSYVLICWRLESPFHWDSPLFTWLFLKPGRSRCLVTLAWGWIGLWLHLHLCWQFYHHCQRALPMDG